MTENEFDKLWQQAEVEGYSQRLAAEYPGWRRKQQRTISICQYVNGDYAFNFRYFHNLQLDEQEQILNYPLQVYICSGSDSEKLKWFKTINAVFEKYGIARSAWSYREMDFGLSDARMDGVRDELIKYL